MTARFSLAGRLRLGVGARPCCRGGGNPRGAASPAGAGSLRRRRATNQKKQTKVSRGENPRDRTEWHRRGIRKIRRVDCRRNGRSWQEGGFLGEPNGVRSEAWPVPQRPQWVGSGGFSRSKSTCSSHTATSHAEDRADGGSDFVRIRRRQPDFRRTWRARLA